MAVGQNIIEFVQRFQDLQTQRDTSEGLIRVRTSLSIPSTLSG